MASNEYSIEAEIGKYRAIITSDKGEVYASVKVDSQYTLRIWSLRLGVPLAALESSLVKIEDDVYAYSLVSKLDHDSYYIGLWRIRRLIGGMLGRLKLYDEDITPVKNDDAKRLVFNMMVSDKMRSYK